MMVILIVVGWMLCGLLALFIDNKNEQTRFSERIELIDLVVFPIFGLIALLFAVAQYFSHYLYITIWEKK